MTTTLFRNVDCDITQPVHTWPGEAIEIVLDRGRRSDWARLATEIERSPWGRVARTVETIAGWGEHYGTDKLMLAIIERARHAIITNGRQGYADRLRRLRHDAGLTLDELATLAGTSASRLSAYEHGHVSPTTDALARLEHAAVNSRPATSPTDR